MPRKRERILVKDRPGSCEWNPDADRPCTEDDTFHAVSVYSVGVNGVNLHLCEECAKLFPRRKRVRLRKQPFKVAPEVAVRSIKLGTVVDSMKQLRVLRGVRNVHLTLYPDFSGTVVAREHGVDNPLMEWNTPEELLEIFNEEIPF